jgi:hypothetical protein
VAALYLGVGFLELHPITVADVAPVRLGEVTAQQVDREGVAGDVFDEALEFGFGSPDAEGFQQFDAGGGREVLEA